MAGIRALDRIKEKFVTVTPMRSNEYEYGVKNPRRQWAAATSAGADSYKAGIQEAIANGRFTKGVKRAGDAKWNRGCTEKGVQRFGPGVQVAGDDYATGFAPFHTAISNVRLSQRYAKGDPRNLQRVKDVVDALVKTKTRQLAGG